MELVSSKINIDFMKMRYVCAAASLLLICYCFFVWFQKGDAKYGVDFLGGTDLVVKFDKQIDIGEIRKVLAEAGISGAIVQAFEGGTQDFSIRLKSDKGAETGKKLREVLSKGIESAKFEVLREDFVGPIIGEQIRKDGLTSIFVALVCILIYISFRFEWRFAVGAIIALLHDVIITTGVFVFTGREISAAVLAALLTIIGYSLNDTIIVFDRVRENLALSNKSGSDKAKKGKPNKAMSFYNLINLSVSQTLSRTVLTSITTLFVVTSLWLLGGGAVADLAFALVIGVVVGTYSSIFVACTSILALESTESSAEEKQLKKANS